MMPSSQNQNEGAIPFRPAVEKLAGYKPGEQPQDGGWIKLNTNENPYPPSGKVKQAIRNAADANLNRYPDPVSKAFCNVASKLFHVTPDWILPANGSDENLTILLRTFVEPGETICFPYPSYVLYGTLAEIQGAQYEHLPLNADWSINQSLAAPIIERSRIVFLPNPNSPSGHCWSDEEIQFCIPPNGVLVLDEAYGDFRESPHCGEALQSENGNRIVITRTLSKSYSLAGIRFGYAVAHPNIIAGMLKVKDSYNCDSIAMAAATAALSDQQSMQNNANRIRDTRTRMEKQLAQMGFNCFPSEANFVWAIHQQLSHQSIFEQLKKQKILVRFMTFPGSEAVLGTDCNGLRITVGTDEEVDAFLKAMTNIVNE